MIKNSSIFILVFVITLASCGGGIRQRGTSSNFNSLNDSYTEPETLTTSLFSPKNQTISEENIHKILDGKIVLPEKVRIAVYKYSGTTNHRYYAGYWQTNEYLQLQQNYLDTLVGEIQKSKRVDKIFPIPSMMMSKTPNITELRESAVRLQADLLLVFSVRSDIYSKYKMFSKNLSKAFATCESIVLDTRTGVVPHSDIVTQDFLVSRESEDWSDEEMRNRAENGAILQSLGKTGRGIGIFLNESKK